MHLYGAKKHDGPAWCGCCGGKLIHTRSRTAQAKVSRRAAKKRARANGKKEIQDN